MASRLLPRAVGTLALAFIVFLPAALAAQEPGGGAPLVRVDGGGQPVRAAAASVSVRGDVGGVRAAGALVDIDANVSGGVRAAGARVSIDGEVARRVQAAGASVDVGARVGGDVNLAGAVVTFSGNAESDVALAGAAVEVASGASVAGDLSAHGAVITVEGSLARGAVLGGAIVTFDGTAAGRVEIDAERIVVGPTARIGGDLVIRSHSDPVIAEGATVSGQVVREEPRRWWQYPSWLWYGMGAVIMAVGAFLAAVVLLVIGRGAFDDALEHAAFRPLSSGLLGLATVVVLPILAVVLAATVVGVTIGVALLLLLPIILVAGHALAAAGIGLWVVDRTGPPRSFGRVLVFVIVGAVILALVGLVPLAGPILVFLAILVGAGGYVRAAAARLHRSAHSFA